MTSKSDKRPTIHRLGSYCTGGYVGTVRFLLLKDKICQTKIPSDPGNPTPFT